MIYALSKILYVLLTWLDLANYYNINKQTVQPQSEVIILFKLLGHTRIWSNPKMLCIPIILNKYNIVIQCSKVLQS